ncbi:hypothetical protein [Zymobacter sp. IVIA_12111.31 C1]|uniref:hypothetical protein n=1 Tax=Zymobacter sp. IVIA_12111.31 C1 TaxID=3394854 RepID=UPI0039C02A66
MAKNETLDSNKKQSEVKYIKPEVGSGFITPPRMRPNSRRPLAKNRKTRSKTTFCLVNALGLPSAHLERGLRVAFFIACLPSAFVWTAFRYGTETLDETPMIKRPKARQPSVNTATQ